jgi:Na+-driven multidrug efflux pump
MNTLLTRASEVSEATGISGAALGVLIAIALAVVLGVSYVYVRNRRRRGGE